MYVCFVLVSHACLFIHCLLLMRDKLVLVLVLMAFLVLILVLMLMP